MEQKTVRPSPEFMAAHNDVMRKLAELEQALESPEVTPTIREATKGILSEVLDEANFTMMKEYAETGRIRNNTGRTTNRNSNIPQGS